MLGKFTNLLEADGSIFTAPSFEDAKKILDTSITVTYGKNETILIFDKLCRSDPEWKSEKKLFNLYNYNCKTHKSLQLSSST
jgi:hypothetical protein